MVKINVDIEEWWPVYEVCGRGYELEIPDDKDEWLHNVFQEFEKVQDYLRDMYRAEEKRQITIANADWEAENEARIAAYKEKRLKEIEANKCIESQEK